jgi:hypothetical protein
MKITLAEFDAFSKQLSDDWYFEGDESFIDEMFWEGKFDPADVINVGSEEITLCYQGKEHKSEDEKYIDFLPVFKKWKSGLDFDIVAVKIPKGKKDELLKIIEEKFGKVTTWKTK